MNDVPHVWYTTDEDNNSCRHLAMNRDGAMQAHMLHHGMMGLNGAFAAVDEGAIGSRTNRDDVCFDPSCVLYGLSFPRDEVTR